MLIEQAATWADDDIQRLRDFRKRYARREQEADDKAERRDCQKFVKAATLLIDYFDGKRATRDIPAELRNYALMASAHLYPR